MKQSPSSRVRLAAACAMLAFTGAASAQTVKVGIAQDLSGPFAALGAEARDGFNLAIKQLGGKLGGLNAEIIAQDMAGNPDNARQLVERMVKRDRVDFFTGPIGSNVALAVGPALFAERVFYLSNNAGPSQFAGSQCNPFFFGTAWQNDAYHEAAGKFVASRDFKRVAIMAPNYPAGQDALTGFKRGFGKPVASETFTKLGQLDYAAELAQLRAQNPDALYIFLPGGMGINFVKQFFGAGLSKNTQIIAPGFSGDQDVIRAVGDAMLGTFNTAHWNHDFDNAASRSFVEAFRKEYKRTPSLSGPVELLPGFFYPSYRLLIIGVGLTCALLLYVLVAHTRAGQWVRAGASRREMAAVMGVPVARLFSAVFAVGAALAALAGALLGPVLAVEVGMGENILILALVVIVIGGIGSVRGAFVGALLVGMVDTAGRAFLPTLLQAFLPLAVASNLGPALAAIAIYVLMAAVLFFRPGGLFPARA